jgi:starch synthase
MKILFVAAEVAPFAKVGGLADVVGSLPKALEQLGHDVKILKPKYRQVDSAKWGLRKFIDNWEISRPLPGLQTHFDAYKTQLPKSNVETIFIANDFYFNRPEIYLEKGKDYEDNAERFAFFCRAVMAVSQGLNWQPDIVHCHDWQTALVPTYQKIFYMDDPFWKKVRSVFTIHNLAYQGLFPPEKLGILGLPDWTFQPRLVEFWGKINLMKSGLVYSDRLTTVSRRYSEEIQTQEYGCGLEGILIERKEDLSGIVNGIDYDEWNPATDSELAAHFSVKDLSGKKINKVKLLKDNHLPVKRKDTPVIGLVSRLADQKGFDIIAEVADEILSLDIQMVILGTGEPKYHELFENLQKKYPKKIAVNLKFDAYLAKMIYAGSDMFLMPSRFEPCGLGQMISLAYGTIPLVRATGGLADTIQDYNPETRTGTGFVFSNYSGADLFQTVKRAVEAYQNKPDWSALVKNALHADFSWDASAKKYSELYLQLIH